MKVFITGSNLYNHENLQWETIETIHGKVEWLRGKIFDSEHSEEIILLPRHGKNHKNLPNTINYLANFEAIKSVNPDCVISFSVCGMLNNNIPLKTPFVPQDFFFPENRLPDGKICTIFQREREGEKGHLIPVTNYFNTEIQSDIAEIFTEDFNQIFSGTYVHANGPRFNSKAEIRSFQNIGGDAVSQTCGPEIVLCNELEIPFGMLCVGIDYANGVSEIPTSPEELGQNLGTATEIFLKAIENFSQKKSEHSKNIPEKKYQFQNFLFTI